MLNICVNKGQTKISAEENLIQIVAEITIMLLALRETFAKEDRIFFDELLSESINNPKSPYNTEIEKEGANV